MYATAELLARGRASRASTAIEPPASADFAWRVLEEIDYGLLLVSPSGALQHANHRPATS
ncbi:hypothetical protein HK414_12095 [Ramlibacter terrae]|uniref:Uncharacterized protein n=1 Tax=Ramlibacter terrae TaxID=2732511 RepID=A0ABX6P582_9BURK|nr:hypothetical protein HK414_12095 [Ramlibacter terrae]